MSQGSSQSSFDSLLGRLIIDRGLATNDEVDAALKRRRDRSGDSGGDNNRSLADTLISAGIVTKKQVDRLRPELDEAKAGRQIPGYQVISKLGSGAMATVYKAKQLSLDRMVAIKILPKKYAKDPDFIRRFYDEGKAAAKLNHPHLVAAIDVGKSGEYHYFVMEFVDGRTVYDDIVKDGIHSEKDAIRLGIQIAEALRHAHEKGFIHRDVKPKNIMMTKGGDAKLADMGLARAISDTEAAEAEAGKAFGTPYYISPEQVRGLADVDIRADIYSLGATIYHMVTGRVPYDGPNPSAVMSKHLKEDLVPPDHVNKSLSQGMAEVIEVAMAKDRAHRYQDCAELIADLKAVAAGEAPARARRQLDLNSLTALEQQGTELDGPATAPKPSLGQQPLFWAALAGWVAALLMLAVALLG